MAFVMDEKDRKIIEALKEHAKLSTQQIAKKTLIPTTTVHNRIRKLEKEGIIKGYTVVLDNRKLGRNLAAYVFLSVDHNIIKKIGKPSLAREIRKMEFVEDVALITGTHDMIIKARVESIDQLDKLVVEKIRNLDGIARTETCVILSEV